MDRISEITKRDIFEMFINGLPVSNFFDNEIIQYPYYGRLEEIDFLERLYLLDQLPSTDSRFVSAREDIWQHTINNDDYPFGWVFADERFDLLNGIDEHFLRFLCEVFHPAVRNENGHWKQFFDKVNELLRHDRYELYVSNKISNRYVYSWRIYDSSEGKLFIPFSQRNMNRIDSLQIKINRHARRQIFNLLNNFNYQYEVQDESGYYSLTDTMTEVFKDIRQFYVPKSYNAQKRYAETDDFHDFVINGARSNVLDAIELFSKHSPDSPYETQMNQILQINQLPLRLANGKIGYTSNFPKKSDNLANVQEAGLKELLQEAYQYYDQGNYKIAVEKIWDTFERLKTYYSPSLSKNVSAEKIVTSMSKNAKEFHVLFDAEFRELTKIGNNFRIRHHETTKIDINDEHHYEYLYNRCLSLIIAATQFIQPNSFL